MGLKDEHNITIGTLKRGKRNLITDVEGVTVGHVTLCEGSLRTGVTAILPHQGNLFQNKVMAAAYVINGFGKSAGLLQIDELGSIETPILMTNTLSVGTGVTALVRYMLEQNADIGVSTGTVNCVVTECNDGVLNDIRRLGVTECHVRQALENTGEIFAEGNVGAGTGMTCMGVKGGIGSASRVVEVDGADHTVGAIVLNNFGTPGDLTINGDWIGPRIEAEKARRKAKEAAGAEAESVTNAGAAVTLNEEPKKDLGSVIIVLATDIPLSERQLKRMAKRAGTGLARTGSRLGNGSGDIAIAFTTANQMPHHSDKKILPFTMFYDEEIDCVFRAAIEAVEEAVVSSLYHAERMTGYSGKTVYALRDFTEV